ncbi:hypothetical protein [Bacillus sp. 165]|uniref:hypothetical protein n=1 Tax=Bacillus sp. 165 TaxID=1529117 RepID=UPI001ADD5DD1|nr:hypothetical protein [Bacillus sp. 165]MBO9130145.1 hypothetical protein [Bacillus sp. 165]
MKEAEIKRGKPITFRIPSDTPDHIIKHLQRLKETEKRNFSSKVAEFVVNGINSAVSKEKEALTIPLPKGLSKEQRDWLKHEHSEALLGSIVYQLLSNPVRTASLLASLNSNALDIEEALYLQEEAYVAVKPRGETEHAATVAALDDLDNFDWEQVQQSEVFNQVEEQEEEKMEDLLGDFLAQMNK